MKLKEIAQHYAGEPVVFWTPCELLGQTVSVGLNAQIISLNVQKQIAEIMVYVHKEKVGSSKPELTSMIKHVPFEQLESVTFQMQPDHDHLLNSKAIDLLKNRVAANDWKGGVFYKHDYFGSVLDLIDHLKIEQISVDQYPRFVWAAVTKKHNHTSFLADVLAESLEEIQEDLSTTQRVKTLLQDIEKAEDLFWQKLGDVLFLEEDRTTAILLFDEDGRPTYPEV